MKSRSDIKVSNALNRPTVFIRHRFQHMGAHSGYDLLVPPLLKQLHNTHSVFLSETQPPAWSRRFLVSIFYRLYASPIYRLDNLGAELRSL